MTAELAIALPAVVLLLVVGLVASSAAITQLRCTDAARAGARAAALGADLATVSGTARTLAGPEAVVSVRREGAWTVVQVRRPVGVRGWFAGPLVAAAEARAWNEPVAAADGPLVVARRGAA